MKNNKTCLIASLHCGLRSISSYNFIVDRTQRKLRIVRCTLKNVRLKWHVNEVALLINERIVHPRALKLTNTSSNALYVRVYVRMPVQLT